MLKYLMSILKQCWGGQLSAWASEQNKIIASREIIADKIKELDNEYLNTEILDLNFEVDFLLK